MKHFFSSNLFRSFLPLLDIFIILGTNYLFFYIFRDSLDNFTSNYTSFIYVFPYIAFGYIVLARTFDLERPRDTSFLGISYTITIIIFILLFVTMAISFLIREFAYPRSILLLSSITQIILISLSYWFFNHLYLFANGQNKVIIIGDVKARELASKLLASRTLWSNITKVCYHKSEHLHEWIDKNDVVFITEDVSEDRKQTIIKYCSEKGKRILYEPKGKEILLFNARMMQVDDSPMLLVKQIGISSGLQTIKRCMDVIIGLIGAIVFLIPSIFVYIALKMTGKTAFYVQERVTRGNKVFKIYKFRTMIENAEALSGPVLAQETDKRITRFGAFLRATRLDEVPQIFNILKGDMSIVGPRPERPFFVEQFAEEYPDYQLRHKVKAGLTGLAQVQGRYNTSVRDKLKYDLLYINAYSLALDVKIILQTLNILLRKDSTQGVKSDENLEKEVMSLWQD